MHVDQNAQLRAEALTQRVQDVVGQLQFRLVNESLRRAEGVELERLESHGNDLLGCQYEMLRRALRPVPAVGVRGHGIAHPPAQQLVDRDAQGLAQNVPACDLDGRDGGSVYVPAVQRYAVHQVFRQAVDLPWILADGQVLQFAHRSLGGADEPVEGALADSMNAAAGMDP